MKSKKLLILVATGAIGLVGFTGATAAFADGTDIPGIAGHIGHMGGGPGTAQGTETGPYHDQMQAAAATALGITVDDLNTQLTAGKTIAQIAQERGIDFAKVQAAMQAARPAGTGRGLMGDRAGTGPANGTPGTGDCPYVG